MTCKNEPLSCDLSVERAVMRRRGAKKKRMLTELSTILSAWDKKGGISVAATDIPSVIWLYYAIGKTWGLLPGHLKLPLVVGTIPQIEVDQGLIGNTLGIGQGLEIVNGTAIDVDGDLLLEPTCIGIFPGIQFVDVVFVSHTITSNSIKINLFLGFGCPSCRDNADAVFLVTIAMAHNTDLL